jgi:threonine/homoserine/homoserine lactone efflux protein
MNLGLVGFALGWVSSMPLGGPVSLFVFKRGAAGRYRDAILLASGAALAEAGYCAAALFGYGLLMDRWPMARPIITVVGALIMVGLGVHFLVARHFRDEVEPPPTPTGWVRDLTLGFSMVGFNPSVMVHWLALLAALHAVGIEPGTPGGRLLFVGCVAAGIVSWFTLLTWLLHHGRARIRPALLCRTLRVFGGGLCAVGLYVLFTQIA